MYNKYIIIWQYGNDILRKKYIYRKLYNIGLILEICRVVLPAVEMLQTRNNFL